MTFYTRFWTGLPKPVRTFFRIFTWISVGSAAIALWGFITLMFAGYVIFTFIDLFAPKDFATGFAAISWLVMLIGSLVAAFIAWDEWDSNRRWKR